MDSVEIRNQRIYPDISTSGDTLLNCKIDRLQLEGHSSSDSISYYWTKIEDSLFVEYSKPLSVQNAGSYVFHVKDTNNACVSKDTVWIHQDINQPTVEISLVHELSCVYNETLLDAEASSKGPDFKYQWTTLDGQIVQGENTLQLLVSKAGTYNLQIENTVNYCKNSKTKTVLQKSAPLADFSQAIMDHTAFFSQQSTGIPDSYYWTFGDGSFSDVANPIHTYPDFGEYTVCLEIKNDCGTHSLCKNLIISQSGILSISNSKIKHVKCFDDATGSIELTVQGGFPPYRFEWSNQATTKDLYGIKAGDYTVKINDQQSNLLEKTFTVDQAVAILLDRVDILSTTSGQNEGSILLSLSGGVQPFQYSWSNQLTGNPILQLAAGNYLVTITDENLCQKSFGPFEVKELTGTSEKDLLQHFSISPNPSIDAFWLDVRFAQRQAFQVNLYDVLGQSVWKKTYEANQIREQLVLPQLAKGIYFVELQFDYSKHFIKCILQ